MSIIGFFFGLCLVGLFTHKLYRANQGLEGLVFSYYPKGDQIEKYPPNIGGLIFWGILDLIAVLMWINATLFW